MVWIPNTHVSITSAFSCIRESVHVPIFHISFVRTLFLKIRGLYFHFTQAHNEISLFRRHFLNFSFDTLC